MRWIYYYATLIVLFLILCVYAAFHPGHIPSDLRIAASLLTMLTALGQSLVRSNFKLYLFSQKIWLLFNRHVTALWRFSVRLDGHLGPESLSLLEESLTSEMKQWSPKIISRDAVSLRMIVDRTIHITCSFEASSYSEDGLDHIVVRSDELEVTYGSARKKIDSCILPLMGILTRRLRPDTSSSTLEVFFGAKNPFFAFYVAHLPQEQVTRFNLVFKPSVVTRSDQDRVVVSQKSVAINASSPEAFAILSKAFILLSEDASTMQAL